MPVLSRDLTDDEIYRRPNSLTYEYFTTCLTINLR